VKDSVAVFSALSKNWLRSKSGVFFSFMFPVMLLLIFGTVFAGAGDQTYTLHVQNLDLENGTPTGMSTALINILNSTGTFRIENLGANVDITTYVRENPSFTNYRILVIPENFQQRAMNRSIYIRTGVILDTLNLVVENYGPMMTENQTGSVVGGIESVTAWQQSLSPDNAEILLLTDEGDTSALVVKGVIASIIDAFNKQLTGAGDVVGIAENNLSQRGFKAVDYYLPGYIAAFIMTNGIIGVASNTSEFRRNGVIKRLAATPLRKSSWIIGNVLHQAFLAFILTLTMVGIGWVIFGVRAIPDVYAVALIFLGSVVFSGIGIVIGGAIKDVEAASAAGNAIGFPMMFLSGAFWPVEMMPAFMQSVAKCMPLYYFHDGLRQIMIYQNPVQALLPFAIFGALAVVFVYLAVRMTKWKEL
jgi:ABC-2 type transport system permease protein